MKIKDIRLRRTNQTRTDGRYPLRIGSEVEFYMQPTIGMSMHLSYVKDNQGNPKDGILHTSRVINLIEDNKEIIVTTYSSIYYFEK